jgi:hypothetical protein
MYLLLTCSLILVVGLSSANADPIAYAFYGTGSGAFTVGNNATEFDSAFFQIRLIGDTLAVAEDTDPLSPFFGQFSNIVSEASIFVSGVTINKFLNPLIIYLDPSLETVGIAEIGNPSDPLDDNTLLEFDFPLLIGGYDLSTDFGPVTATIGPFTFASDMLLADGSVLGFEDIAEASFVAASPSAIPPIPEPGTVVFLGSGLLGFVLLKLRGRKS